MKWFTHETAIFSDIKVRMVFKKYGHEGIGLWWRVLEVIASQDQSLAVDTTKCPVDVLADIIPCQPPEKLKEYLDYLAAVELISKESWASGVIFSPQLGDWADEYTKKVLRSKKLGRTPENIGTLSGQCTPLKEEKRIEEKKREEIRLEMETLWNGFDLVKVQEWTVSRKELLDTRLKEPCFVEKWREALTRLGTSDFAAGKGPAPKDGGTPWRADIDWFLKNDTNYVKALEGKYDNQVFDKYTRRT